MAAVRSACALSAYQVTRAPDTDLRAVDLAAFNVSTALMVFVDDLVFATTRAAIEARAGCERPPFARYTPYRFRVDWARTGTLAVWEPVDPSGRMIAKGLEWWKCTDRDAAVAQAAPAVGDVLPSGWTRAALGDCDSASRKTQGPPGTLTARVCTPGYYVLAASSDCAPDAPFGADCVVCAAGRFGCTCEFTDASLHDADTIGAVFAWSAALVLSLTFLENAATLFALRQRERDRVALDLARGPLTTRRAVGATASATVHMLATLDTVLIRVGKRPEFSYTACAFAFAHFFACAAWLFTILSHRSPRRPERLLHTALLPVSYALSHIFAFLYLDPRPAVLALAIALVCVLVALAVASQVLIAGSWRRLCAPMGGYDDEDKEEDGEMPIGYTVRASGALGTTLLCAVLSLATVLSRWDAPCAATTLVDASAWP